MNYLRSAVLAVVSTSALVFAAGCADAPEVDQAPTTEVGGSGLDPQAPSGPVCPASDPASYQVQASRIAKYLFGGNDPFDADPDAAASKEYGEAGYWKPKMNEECKRAAEIWHKIGDQLWMYGGKEGNGPTAWLGSAPNTTACGLKADLFILKSGLTDEQTARLAALTDYCWGEGVSGFIVTGVAAQPPNTCPTDDASKKAYEESLKKNPDKRQQPCTPYVAGAMGFDPEPANLGKPLGSTTGSTAAATYVNTGVAVDVIEWPATYLSGASIVPGTPCHTAPLSPGALTSKAIVAATPTSPLRRCM